MKSGCGGGCGAQLGPGHTVSVSPNRPASQTRSRSTKRCRSPQSRTAGQGSGVGPRSLTSSAGGVTGQPAHFRNGRGRRAGTTPPRQSHRRTRRGPDGSPPRPRGPTVRCQARLRPKRIPDIPGLSRPRLSEAAGGRPYLLFTLRGQTSSIISVFTAFGKNPRGVW